MKKNIRLILIVLLGCGLLAAANSSLADESDIKARMKARLPKIDALMARGIIGENNQGYLEYRGNKKPDADMIAAVNRDRKIVYQAIASKLGTTVDKVGSRRARQIRENAEPGTWIQEPDGQWTRK